MLSKPYASLSFGNSALALISKREQVADGVAVLGAIESMQRLQAGVRVRRRCGVELRLEERDELGRRFRVRQWLAGRRHHAAAQLLDDGFPGLGVRADFA